MILPDADKVGIKQPVGQFAEGEMPAFLRTPDDQVLHTFEAIKSGTQPCFAGRLDDGDAGATDRHGERGAVIEAGDAVAGRRFARLLAKSIGGIRLLKTLGMLRRVKGELPGLDRAFFDDAIADQAADGVDRERLRLGMVRELFDDA